MAWYNHFRGTREWGGYIVAWYNLCHGTREWGGYIVAWYNLCHGTREWGGYIVAWYNSPKDPESGGGYIVAQYNHSNGIRHWGIHRGTIFTPMEHRVKKHPRNYKWYACHILPLLGGGWKYLKGGEDIVTILSYDIFIPGREYRGWK